MVLSYVALAAALALALVALEAWRRDRAQARELAGLIAELERREAEAERLAAERRRLVGELLSAEADERKRIAADMHDDSIQALGAALLRMELLEEQLTDPEHRRALAIARESTRAAIQRLRHQIFELTPPALAEHGLVEALRTWLEQAEDAWGTRFEIDSRLEAEPPEPLGALIYRIAVEAAGNAAKHAQAARIEVALRSSDGGILVRVADDGTGFAPEAASAPGHLGLRSMSERAESAGGWWRVESAPEHGTRVEFWVPLKPERPV